MIRLVTKWVTWSFPLIALAACHGNDGVQPPVCASPTMASPDDANAVALVVDQGPVDVDPPYVNGLFATATVCVPGTNDCQTIDHLLVDTGSMGLRVLGSLLATLPLPVAKTDSGLLLAECYPLVSGSPWGLIKVADVQIGGEFARNIPIQVIGNTAVSDNLPVPASCGAPIITELNGSQGLGANGILGVGLFPVDCGSDCATTAQSIYYACSASCRPTTVPVAQQVPNPVAAFPVDNNGVLIQLPCIPERGAPSVPGTMVFGIGTQANNGLGSAKVLTTSSIGMVNTAFPSGGRQYMSFLDTGSNGLYFLDASTSGLKLCPSGGEDFYCPPSTTNLTAAITGSNEENAPLVFSVANPMRFPNENFAFSNLAGPFPSFPAFDWGLPFYFGRSVYTAIEGASTPAGPGPYFAF
jgi:hypothetical protein